MRSIALYIYIMYKTIKTHGIISNSQIKNIWRLIFNEILHFYMFYIKDMYTI